MSIPSRRSLARVWIAAASLASGSAGSALGQVCGSGGSCVQPGTQPGCEDAECCLVVCSVDPLCCAAAWDGSCALLASELCVGLCGANASGPCSSPHPNPACSNEACCELVCGLDAFCCDVQWDFTCAVLAGFNCTGGPGTCGDPGAGSCTEPHPTGACSDAECCEVVCSLDPSCCSSSWDLLCVSLAETYCLVGCSLTCPEGAFEEQEPCGERVNDPCLGAGLGQAPEILGCDEEVCGRVFVDPKTGDYDSDAYSITVPFTGGETTRIRFTFSMASEGFLAVLPQGCTPLDEAVLVIETSLCATVVETPCLPPGNYLCLVAPGTPDDLGGPSRDCIAGAYRLAVECLDPCGDVCGGAEGACSLPHGGLGCDDPACCAAVCAIDPACCVDGWDSLCVEQAIPACGLTPPANDLCAEAIDVPLGSTSFTSLLATTDGPALPAECDEGFGLSLEDDVWFRHEATCSGPLRIETCAELGFDTRMAVYEGSCVTPAILACNDDAPLCSPTGASRVLIEAVCGEVYLIRVGGYKGASGVGVLTLTCLGGPCVPPCPADLDDDATVGGADLTMLLSAWGGTGPVGDLNGDGIVDGADLTALLAAWGQCP